MFISSKYTVTICLNVLMNGSRLMLNSQLYIAYDDFHWLVHLCLTYENAACIIWNFRSSKYPELPEC